MAINPPKGKSGKAVLKRMTARQPPCFLADHARHNRRPASVCARPAPCSYHGWSSCRISARPVIVPRFTTDSAAASRPHRTAGPLAPHNFKEGDDALKHDGCARPGLESAYDGGKWVAQQVALGEPAHASSSNVCKPGSLLC